MIGVLKLRLGWATDVVVHGGPYKESPEEHFFNVKLAAEQPYLAHLTLSAGDYGPFDPDECEEALDIVLRQLLNGVNVYVGCGWGWGRTGTFFALLSKIAGLPDPIEYVRETYHWRAVESLEQERMVEEFDPRPLQRKLRRWKLQRLLLPGTTV